jgi:hypothetical protein
VAAGAARAEPAAPRPARRDGYFVGLGPVAALVRQDGGLEGGFGGELVLARVRWASDLTALGASAGGVDYATRDGGRLWLEMLVGSRRPFGAPAGLALGVTAEVDPARAPRPGWQATLWVHAGVVPYLRVGGVERSGVFAEAGIQIVLPVLRWR